MARATENIWAMDRFFSWNVRNRNNNLVLEFVERLFQEKNELFKKLLCFVITHTSHCRHTRDAYAGVWECRARNPIKLFWLKNEFEIYLNLCTVDGNRHKIPLVILDIVWPICQSFALFKLWKANNLSFKLWQISRAPPMGQLENRVHHRNLQLFLSSLSCNS